MIFNAHAFGYILQTLRLRGIASPHARRLVVALCLSLGTLSGLTLPMQAAVYDMQDNAVQHARNGQLLMERGQVEEAIEEFKAAIQLNPYASMAAPLYNNLGMAYKALKNYPYAYASFQRACRLQPTFSLFYKNLAEAYVEAGQFTAAETTFLGMAQNNPDNAEAWFMLGLLYREQGNRTASMHCFKRFLALQPESEMAQAARAALK